MSFKFNDFLKIICSAVSLSLISFYSFPQALSGSYTIPGSYPTISAAISALNGNGVSGQTTFIVTVGYTETFASSTAGLINIAVNPPTSSSPVVFKKGAGNPDPIITAGTGVGAMDGIIVLQGIDYITFDGIDVHENAGNGTNTTRMEWGYALLKNSETVGSQYDTIRNCSITLNKSNMSSIGIYSDNISPSLATQYTLTAASGTNSYNEFDNNVISNVYTGIYINGYNDPVYAYYDQNNKIGVNAGNPITNFGGNTSTACGINVSSQNGLKIANNTITAGTLTTGALYGIITANATNANIDIFNNTITPVINANVTVYGISNGIGSAGTNNTVNIYNNTIPSFTGSGGSFYGISNTATAFNVNIYNNKVSSITGGITKAGILNSSSAGNVLQIYGNTISNITITGSWGAGAIIQYKCATGRTSVYSNSISNFTINGSGTENIIYCSGGTGSSHSCYSNSINTVSYPPAGDLNGLSYSGICTTDSIYNNTLSNISYNSTGPGAFGMTGMLISSTGYHAVFKNNINNLSNGNGGNISCLSVTGTTVDLYKNIVHAITCTGNIETVYGINVSGTLINVYNNMISDLKTPAATSGGINIYGLQLGGTTVNAYYNSIYLNATSSGDLSTVGISTSTTSTITLTNNLVVNKSTPTGTGIAVAHYRSGASVANLTANYNDYYVTPGANNYIGYDAGTPAVYSTLSSYQGWATSEANSITADPGFPAGTGVSDLHKTNMTNPNPLVSAGTVVAYVSDDIDGQVRSCPEIGYDEWIGCLYVSPNTTICLGTSTTLTAGNGNGYSWFPSGNLSSSNGASVTASPTTATTYTITDTVFGNTNSTTIGINTLPTLAISNSSTICAGLQPFLSVAGAITNNYLWMPSATLNSSTAAIVIASPIVSTTYTVIGTDINGCVNTISTNVGVYSLPTVTLSSNASICIGTMTNLSAVGATSYTWSPSASLNTYTGSLVIASPTVSTTYTVAGTDVNNCIDTVTIFVNVNPLPIVSISPPNIAICFGDSTTLTASAITAQLPVTYLWTPPATLSSNTGVVVIATPTTTSSYTVIGTDGNGCYNIASANVSVTSTLLITISPANNLSICEGTSITLTASGGITYSWAPAIALSNYTNATVTAGPTTFITYYVTGANGSCTGEDSITISIYALPIVMASSDVSICPGNTTTLTVTGATTYIWNPATTPLNTATVSASPNATTTYTVTGTDGNGCQNDATIQVTVNIPIQAAISPDITIIAGLSTVISATNGGTSYLWTPADFLNCNTCQSITAGPTVTTVYTVTMGDANGCFSSDTVTVDVIYLCGELFVPNAFSPNADNVNDALYVYGTENCIDPNSYTFQIYDRWGNLVFSSSVPGQGWDGKYQNMQLDAAVFVYKLTYSVNKTSLNLKGNISLIR